MPDAPVLDIPVLDAPMLDVDVERRQGDFHVQARFTAGAGLTALFGRSGSGKTSLVDMIAGLARPDRGRIVVDGAVLFDHARGIDLPPRKRRLGYVFQEDRLFPHLTVRQNLRYGQFFTPAAERFVAFEPVVDLLGLGHRLDCRPGVLSGGEKQRVAIGRALLTSPRLLLMDEPLASLDLERKSEILPYIERLRDAMRLPVVYVSHAIEEVTRLANTLVLLSEGTVAACGPLEAVMSRLDLHPLTGRYEAGAVIEARVLAQVEAFGMTVLGFAGGELRVPHADLPVGHAVRARIRARDVAVALERPTGLSIQNVLPGRIEAVTQNDGPFAELRLAVGQAHLIARVTRQAVHELGLTPGLPVFALVKGIALDRRSLGLSGQRLREPVEG